MPVRWLTGSSSIMEYLAVVTSRSAPLTSTPPPSKNAARVRSSVNSRNATSTENKVR